MPPLKIRRKETTSINEREKHAENHESEFTSRAVIKQWIELVILRRWLRSVYCFCHLGASMHKTHLNKTINHDSAVGIWHTSSLYLAVDFFIYLYYYTSFCFTVWIVVSNYVILIFFANDVGNAIWIEPFPLSDIIRFIRSIISNLRWAAERATFGCPCFLSQLQFGFPQ